MMMLKRITVLLALVFLFGTMFTAPLPVQAAGGTKEVTAILIGEKNENYNLFVEKFAEMGITVQLVQQIDLPDPSVLFPPAGGTLDVWWNATLLLEKNNVLPVDWTDLILVSTPEPYFFEGQPVYPGITDVVNCPDGTEWPERLKPVRNTKLMGINVGQGGLHGLAHDSDAGWLCDIGVSFVGEAFTDEWLGLSRYDGSTHIVGQAEMSDVFGEQIALDDPRYLDLRYEEDGVDGWCVVPGATDMSNVAYRHEVWLLAYRERKYNFLTNWVNWLHEGQVTTETFADTSDRNSIAAVIGIRNDTDTFSNAR